ncbi:MAG: hypothetical protein ACYCXJ_06790, partial [Thermoleophilia bacterium]
MTLKKGQLMLSSLKILLFIIFLIAFFVISAVNALAFPPAYDLPPEYSGRGTATATPASGPPCSVITIEGSDFDGLRHVGIGWHNQDGNRNLPVVYGLTDSDWNFSLDITVPGDAQPGTNWIN